MTRLISLLIIVLALLGAWGIYRYYESYQGRKETARQAAAPGAVVPERLPGMPSRWEPSLRAAEQQGTTALGMWLKQYGRGVQDPRKAWIELDYCVMLAREDPAGAKRIFAAVKDRTPASSPVWPRVQQLAKTLE